MPGLHTSPQILRPHEIRSRKRKPTNQASPESKGDGPRRRSRSMSCINTGGPKRALPRRPAGIAESLPPTRLLCLRESLALKASRLPMGQSVGFVRGRANVASPPRDLPRIPNDRLPDEGTAPPSTRCRRIRQRSHCYCCTASGTAAVTRGRFRREPCDRSRASGTVAEAEWLQRRRHDKLGSSSVRVLSPSEDLQAAFQFSDISAGSLRSSRTRRPGNQHCKRKPRRRLDKKSNAPFGKKGHS